MVFVLEFADWKVSCALSGCSLVVLCIDEEHYQILKACETDLLSVACEEFGNELKAVRYYLERG